MWMAMGRGKRVKTWRWWEMASGGFGLVHLVPRTEYQEVVLLLLAISPAIAIPAAMGLEPDKVPKYYLMQPGSVRVE